MITDIIAILNIDGGTYLLESRGKMLNKIIKEEIEFIIKNDFNEVFDGVDQVVDVILEKLGIELNYRRI
ncbi:hypothetical protein [Proteocatella sphenisci]|uniref:hypothetical protein n=1 Tax=Proteocatella sphenisci TaxID=181070 RepID=UPI0004914FDD|nr:hypothetical protein [Proteocatella sphenisci]